MTQTVKPSTSKAQTIASKKPRAKKAQVADLTALDPEESVAEGSALGAGLVLSTPVDGSPETFDCGICGQAVRVGATECPHCGQQFLEFDAPRTTSTGDFMPMGGTGETTLSVAPVILQGSTVTSVPLSNLRAWALNPRKAFEEASIAELAESIAHKGLMQNLVVRDGKKAGTFEVIAGGRRLKALQLLEKAGRIEKGYEVPVRVAILNDLEALQLATAENVERQSMTPLEEADAFSKMLDLGGTEADIAARFGYHVKVVHQRVQVARQLSKAGRDAMNAGEISLAQAIVVASAPGPDLQKSLIQYAKNRHSAESLAHVIAQGNIQVQHAQFPLDQYQGEIRRDLFDVYPAFFEDKKQALDLQLKHAKALTQKDLEKGASFAVVELVSSWFSWYEKGYERDVKDKQRAGVLYLLDTRTGELARHEHVGKIVKSRNASASASGEKGPRPIQAGAHRTGHEVRARALRAALLTDHKRAVVITVMSLLGGPSFATSINESDLRMAEVPGLLERLRELDAKVGGQLKVSEKTDVYPVARTHDRYRSSWDRQEGGKQDAALYAALMTLTLDELLDVQACLIAPTVGGWYDGEPARRPSKFVCDLAKDAGADLTFFQITDEWLKGFPRDHLLALAKEAKLDLAPLEACKTQKEIRGKFMEHAERLHAEGFVPRLVRFSEKEA